MMFLDCPAYLDQHGAARCGLPAEVMCRFTMRSTDGLVESAMIRCPVGHYFCGAIESLTWHGQDTQDRGPAARTSRGGRDSGPGSHDAYDSRHRHPNTAPAYYLGRPAALWISVVHPRRTPAAAR